MPFLGYTISGTGLQMNPEKFKVIIDWPQPESLKSTHCFLEFANFYRQFIRNYSLVVAFIVALDKQGVRTSVWPPEAVQAFGTLKKALTSGPILNQSDTSKPFFLKVDASSYGARCKTVLDGWKTSPPDRYRLQQRKSVNRVKNMYEMHQAQTVVFIPKNMQEWQTTYGKVDTAFRGS